jgi:cell division protein FtsB
MQFETVETVENFQLQFIQQQKEIEALKAEVEALKKLIKP